MKILYYDCFAGISGDMNLAAMIALGVDEEHLRTELSKLALDEEFTVDVSADERRSIHGTRVDVVLHGHQHAHGHAHDHHHHHEHRNLKDIEAIIMGSELGETVKATSLGIFRRVAEAEARIHGKALHEVHFHEVGATDSIVDIVGAAICFHALDVDAVWASPIELGGGFVQCAHGVMPVPAPATMEILAGIPTTRGAVQMESTTPTGAAILAELVDRFEAAPQMAVERTAYGIGHRDTVIPNVLRVSLATVQEQGDVLPVSAARLLQCNIDDMTGETVAVAMDRLMEAGAMDVHATPIIMKKGRPALTLSLLCAEADQDKFKRLIFRHTSTLGIKSLTVDKTVLDIGFTRLETPLGSVTMKQAILDGEVIRAKPELEDCRRIAEMHDMPLVDVYLQIGKVRTI